MVGCMTAAQVVEDAQCARELPGHEGSSTGTTDRVGHVEVSEEHALRCQIVQIWRADKGMALDDT